MPRRTWYNADVRVPGARTDPTLNRPLRPVDDLTQRIPPDLRRRSDMADGLIPDERFDPRGLYDPMRYFNPIQQPLTLTVAGADVTVLQAAVQKRVYLLFLNTDPVATIFMNFGQPATAACLSFPPAGNGFEWLFGIPQNEIHLLPSAVPAVCTIIWAELPPPRY